MRKLLQLFIVMLAVCGIACAPEGTGNNKGNSSVSTNTFAITVSNISSTGATVSVAPSNTDTYYFDIVEKSYYDSYTDKARFLVEFVATVKSSYEQEGYTLADALSSGSDSYTFNGNLSANTEYYAFVFGLTSSGNITTNISTKSFRTLEAGNDDNGGEDIGGGTSGGDKILNNYNTGYYINRGDYYETGAKNWYVDIYPDDSLDGLQLEIQTPTTATDFVGAYQFGSSLSANTAVSYFEDAEGYMYGSYWYMLDSEYYVIDYMPCVSGSVVVSKSGDNYTVVVDALDSNGNKITLNYTGVIDEYVEEENSASLLSKKCHARHFRKVAKPNVTPKLMFKKPIPSAR